MAAEAEAREKLLDDERRSRKKKSWWNKKKEVSAGDGLWVPQRGARIGVRTLRSEQWQPATALGIFDQAGASHVGVVYDHDGTGESVPRDRVLQLDAPPPAGDGPEVQWQWFDSGQWWN